MALTPGVRLGPYEIVGPLGAGGMGEVWRARDTRLGRDVAVKVLPAHHAASGEMRERFEREARAIASLNHPHICTLFDVGEHEGSGYLVMELVEGETLAVRLERGPLKLDEALRVALHVAEGLDRAHRSGIVHRDLKPGNIMLTKSGAKILDFGVAKLRDEAGATPAGALPTLTPTRTTPLTTQGSLVGTIQYMAPEQLEGKEADARADLWALGCVLYEMTTGKRAFAGTSHASVITAIMSSQPAPISSLQPMTPPALDRLLKQCLAKDPEERWQTARDLMHEIHWIAQAGPQAGAPVAALRGSRGRERLAWGVALSAVLGAAAALVFPGLIRRTPETRVMRFSVRAPEKVTLFTDGPSSAVSPDGHLLAFAGADSSGTSHIWVRPLESLAPQALEGTDNAALPFWSPDSRNLGFFADGKLKKVPAGGGSPEVLCDAPDARGGSWSKDGAIVFAPVATGPLLRVSAGGGEPVEILTPDATQRETALRFPEFLPDGKHFLFVSLPSRQENFEVHLGSLDSKERKRLLSSGAAAVYAEPGYLIYTRNARLMAQRFDTPGLKLSGEPVPLGEAPPATGPAGSRAVSASANGILIHPAAGLPNTQLVWLDRSGTPQGTVPLPPGRYEGLSISPDGQRVIVERRSSATAKDLWMVELSRGLATRFTFVPSSMLGQAVWSPDGSRVAYNSNRAGTADLYQKLASGAGEEEPLFQSNVQFKNPYQWSPDGKYLTFDQPDAVTGWDLWLLPLAGDRKPVPYLRSPFNESGGWISPDGHWLAYYSDESGKYEIYVQSFPTPGSKYQVSTSGGTVALWSRDGKEMIINGTDGTIQSVDVQTTPAFKAGAPRTLFKLRQDLAGFAATADLQRFLESVPVGEASPSSITLVLNWTAALNR